MVTTVEIKIAAYFRAATGAAKTPPLAADIGTTWSWVNQNSSTAANDVSGALVLRKPRTASDDCAMLVRTLPATPFTVTAELDPAFPATLTPRMGLIYRDSSSGKFLTFGPQSFDNADTKGVLQAALVQWNSATAASAYQTMTNAPNPMASDTQIRGYRMIDGGTNVTCYISWDMINWLQYGSAFSRTGFVASPNQIGVGFSAKDATTAWADTLISRVLDFQIT